MVFENISSSINRIFSLLKDDIYLCVKEDTPFNKSLFVEDELPLRAAGTANAVPAHKCFKCIKFETFKEADIYYQKNYIDAKSSTLIPICNYVPFIFHNTILNYKLSKMFINSKIIKKY
jgi:hypothetical protein